MKCETCENDLCFSWTDTHGIGQCIQCGTPYVIYHYEGEGDSRRRVEKPAESVVDEEYKPLLRAYWKEVGRPIPSGYSFPGGQEIASRDDTVVFGEYFDKHAADFEATNSNLT